MSFPDYQWWVYTIATSCRRLTWFKGRQPLGAAVFSINQKMTELYICKYCLNIIIKLCMTFHPAAFSAVVQKYCGVKSLTMYVVFFVHIVASLG